MIKAIVKYFKNLRETEIDYVFEIEFSIYDILFLIVLIYLIYRFI
jgi:hypothetical protein